MKLTEQEAQHIIPGIYRGSIWIDPPDLKEPDNDEFIRQARQLRQTSPDDCPDFHPTPHAFLSAWITGYRDFPDTREEVNDRGYSNPRVKGFELEYINWHPESRHYTIAGNEGLFAQGTRFHRTLLASDINGMNDQRGYMNVGVNDLVNERVLVWRGVYDGDISEPIPYREVWSAEKIFREDLHFYVWNGKENFPFISPNPLKARGVGGDWTMVGFEPEEVYDVFKKMGFVFP